jgi:hypothetical protein
MFPSQAGCGNSRKSSYLLDVCPRLDFLSLSTLFSEWLS